MTEHVESYTKTKTHEFRIPTREEFHRYAVEILTEYDFNTTYPSIPGYTVDRIASSIQWTKKIYKQNKYRGNDKEE